MLMRHSFKLRWLVAGTLLFCLAVTNASAGADDAYGVAGVELGMDYSRVRGIYPASEIKTQAANCYRFGKAVKDLMATRRVLRQHADDSVLTMSFASPRRGGRLIRIHHDRRVDPANFDLRGLLQRLTARYGGHDRILHRRKMEPAGRIIGFQWHKMDGTRLRMVLRHDHHSNPQSYRLSILATAKVPGPQPDHRPICET